MVLHRTHGNTHRYSAEGSMSGPGLLLSPSGLLHAAITDVPSWSLLHPGVECNWGLITHSIPHNRPAHKKDFRDARNLFLWSLWALNLPPTLLLPAWILKPLPFAHLWGRIWGISSIWRASTTPTSKMGHYISQSTTWRVYALHTEALQSSKIAMLLFPVVALIQIHILHAQQSRPVDIWPAFWSNSLPQ